MDKKCTICGKNYDGIEDLGFAEAPAMCDDCYEAATTDRHADERKVEMEKGKSEMNEQEIIEALESWSNMQLIAESRARGLDSPTTKTRQELICFLTIAFMND